MIDYTVLTLLVIFGYLAGIIWVRIEMWVKRRRVEAAQALWLADMKARLDEEHASKRCLMSLYGRLPKDEEE